MDCAIWSEISYISLFVVWLVGRVPISLMSGFCDVDKVLWIDDMLCCWKIIARLDSVTVSLLYWVCEPNVTVRRWHCLDSLHISSWDMWIYISPANNHEQADHFLPYMSFCASACRVGSLFLLLKDYCKTPYMWRCGYIFLKETIVRRLIISFHMGFCVSACRVGSLFRRCTRFVQAPVNLNFSGKELPMQYGHVQDSDDDH